MIIATPGRVAYHIQNTASFRVNHLKYLVFEEYDRTLDMGFSKDVGVIMNALKEKAVRDFVHFAGILTVVFVENGDSQSYFGFCASSRGTLMNWSKEFHIQARRIISVSRTEQ